MDTFKIKKNDTNPALSTTLKYNDDTVVNLTSATVYFIMANRDYTHYCSGLATVTDAANGICEYRWSGSTDTGSVGTYWGEFETAWTGSKMTLPTDHALQIKVYEDYN